MYFQFLSALVSVFICVSSAEGRENEQCGGERCFQELWKGKEENIRSKQLEHDRDTRINVRKA